MSRLKTYWKNSKTWVCPNHLPSARIPSQVSICYFSSCSSVRPPMDENIHMKNKVLRTISIVKHQDKNKDVRYCSMIGCEKVIPNESKRKKYCSDYCRKKFARKQYTERMKQKAKAK